VLVSDEDSEPVQYAAADDRPGPVIELEDEGPAAGPAGVSNATAQSRRPGTPALGSRAEESQDWWSHAAAVWQARTAILRSHASAGVALKPTPALAALPAAPPNGQPGAPAAAARAAAASAHVQRTRATPGPCTSASPCAVDAFVTMLATCGPSTQRAITEASALSPLARFLRECLLGGVQRRRVELWRGLRERERQALAKATSLPQGAREELLLELCKAPCWLGMPTTAAAAGC